MAKELSRKKLDSNRKNSRKSTGPRTPEGKRVSRWNAVKHGLLAKVAVIEHSKFKESAEDFHELLRRLQAEYEPVGFREGQLIELAAISYFRLQRGLRHENGTIRSSVAYEKKPSRIEMAALPPKDEYDPARTMGSETTLLRRIDRVFAELERRQKVRLRSGRNNRAKDGHESATRGQGVDLGREEERGGDAVRHSATPAGWPWRGTAITAFGLVPRRMRSPRASPRGPLFMNTGAASDLLLEGLEAGAGGGWPARRLAMARLAFYPEDSGVEPALDADPSAVSQGYRRCA